MTHTGVPKARLLRAGAERHPPQPCEQAHGLPDWIPGPKMPISCSPSLKKSWTLFTETLLWCSKVPKIARFE